MSRDKAVLEGAEDEALRREPRVETKVKLLLTEVLYPEDYDLLTSHEGIIREMFPGAENGETVYSVEFPIALPDGRDPWYDRAMYPLLRHEFEVIS